MSEGGLGWIVRIHKRLHLLANRPPRHCGSDLGLFLEIGILSPLEPIGPIEFSIHLILINQFVGVFRRDIFPQIPLPDCRDHDHGIMNGPFPGFLRPEIPAPQDEDKQAPQQSKGQTDKCQIKITSDSLLFHMASVSQSVPLARPVLARITKSRQNTPMSTFAENLMTDLKTAMKAKDTVTLTTLRALKTALTNAAIESGNKDNVVSDADALALVRKQIKQRNDSIEQFEGAGRHELAETEKAEIAVLEKYLPAAMNSEEVSAIVAAAVAETGATTRADMGKVMGIVQAKTEGRVDGKTLSQEVMKHLS